ncbi:MAG: ATP-dependent Clp protease proteolytic subunit [Candidatus Parcubacteria bacterium]|nr:ATP-dependent Clp protease proteolytic subunit [Candidatus Parcubacteria bacterium]
MNDDTQEMRKKQTEFLKEHKVIKLTGTIDKEVTAHVKRMLDRAIDLKINALTLEIATIGGDMIEAGKIFDFISNFPGTITGLVRPFAYSAGACILQACHIRQAMDNSQILFHNARFIYFSLSKFYENMREVNQWAENFDRITLRRSRISPAKFEQLKKLDIPILPHQALSYGLIDQIVFAPVKKTKPRKKSAVKEYDLRLVGEYELKNFLEFLDNMRSENYPPVKIYLKTSTVMKQMIFMFYELLKQYPGHVEVIGIEELINYSLILMLAGDTRKMLYNTKFRLEPPVIHWISPQLPELMTKLGLQIVKEQLRYWDQYLEHEYVSRSQMTPKRYRQMLSADTLYSSQTASQLGIINGITIPKHLNQKK